MEMSNPFGMINLLKFKSLIVNLFLFCTFLLPISSFSQHADSQQTNLPIVEEHQLSKTTNSPDNNDKNKPQLTADITADNIEEVYRELPTNSRWENLTPSENLYQSPYQMSLFSAQHGEDKARLWSQTKSVFGYGFGVIGVIALLPEDVSNWDSNESIFGKWTDNVREGPVWDKDTAALNLIGHPYFGGVYYQVARKSGYRQWDSFLYSVFMSTFYWEYGIEAFAEVPSIQDLVITPVLGWAYGEWAFNTEMDIRESGGEVLGSRALGNTALLLLDPIDYASAGINNLFGKEVIRAGTGFIDIKKIPYGERGQTDKQISVNVSLQFGEGGSQSTPRKKYLSRVNDPVDTGNIGVSYGAGTTELDNAWGLEGDSMSEYSLGIYFSPKFSSRLSYSSGQSYDLSNSSKIKYQNYSVDSQFYFNSDNNLRPYITAGFGESIWAKDRETKRFQVNAGLGVHYKLTNNFAMQLDWRSYYSTRMSTSDNNASARLIYFFGKGQR